MEITVKKLLEETINQQLISMVLSNPIDKDIITKIKVRPVLIKEELLFQITKYIKEKVFHTNEKKEEILLQAEDWTNGSFRQIEINTEHGSATILFSKKGKVTVINKIKKNHTASNEDIEKSEMEDLLKFSHNKKKNYILQEGTALPFLVDLGVMTKEGQVVKAKSDKFKQINRFLEYIEDILPYLEHNRELTILDFGCGKSYLTFAMYHYLKHMKDYNINVIGLDLKKDVIENCSNLSKKYGYDKLCFLEGDIASYTGNNQVDMVVTLHACDTATDHALYKAQSWGAKVILSVPCCQHELNKQMKNETLNPLFQYGIIKERMASLVTDALRAQLLETKGYRVQLLEFIDMEHTPKNILIRAVKRTGDGAEQGELSEELKNCMDFLNVDPCLYRLFQEENSKLINI
ncbi:MAG: SAM-dependent methyltransferase [Mobilitalea sp.]